MRNVFQLFLAANTILLKRNETTLFSFLWSLLRENGRSLRFPKILLKKQTIHSPLSNHDILLNLVLPIIANYYVQKTPEQYPANRKRPSWSRL